MIEDVLAWATSSLLGIGVSTTAILLVLAALQGRRGLKYGKRAAGMYKTALIVIGVLGTLWIGGVIEGINPAPIVELLGWLAGAIGGLL